MSQSVPTPDTDEQVEDPDAQIAEALAEIEDDLERIAEDGSEFAPRAENALEWLEAYREGDDAE